VFTGFGAYDYPEGREEIEEAFNDAINLVNKLKPFINKRI
jgi:hypothetical protein